MDINGTLDKLRQLADVSDPTVSEVERMQDMIHDLDHWLSNGGFLPREWEHHHGFNGDGSFG